jgi:uncharacterized membrane protein
LSANIPTPPSREPVTGRKREAVIWVDKIVLSFVRTWIIWLSLIVGIYAFLPFVAPIAMHNGNTGIARTIYTIYSPMCHQFAFRSWFLYGEQPAYPRARAGSPTLRPFEEVAADEPFFQGIDLTTLDTDLTLAAKQFPGSERMGWKTAFCQRDVAIYAALALFGFAYFILQKMGINVKPLPFWAYLLIAIAPIGLDGFSQLFANPPFNGFGLGLYPIRESTPFLRTLTGGLFGLGNAWLAYPYIEESMEETRQLIEEKLTRAGVLKPRPVDPA